MKASRYALPSSNRTPGATLSVNWGTEDPDYPAGNLGILNPAKPAKLLTGFGSWLNDLHAPVCLDHIALIHHNLDPDAATLTVQANSEDDWYDPPLSEVITIPPDDADGYPSNPWLDLKAAIPAAGDRTYRYWLITVTGNPDPVAGGELLLCEDGLAFECPLQGGLADDEDQPIVEHRTDGGVSTIYHLGMKWRTWSGELDLTEEANITAYRALYQDARGRSRGFFFVPDPDRTDAWFVRLVSTKYSAARPIPGVARYAFGVEELSRGLPL
jgi:hypothetical protein